MTIGIFDKEENDIRNIFVSKFSQEISVFNELLDGYATFLQTTEDKVKTNIYPELTILLFLAQTLPLMDNAISLLSKGYLRSSEALIRIAAEAIILSVFFKEFPKAETDYRNMSYRDFFSKYPIEDMLRKVEKEGIIFIINKSKAKEIKWNSIVFNNLFKESSKFLHNNPDVLFALTKNAHVDFSPSSDITEFIMGPQLYPDDTLALAIRRLFNTLLFSLVVLGVSFGIEATAEQKEVMKLSQEITEKLNR